MKNGSSFVGVAMVCIAVILVGTVVQAQNLDCLALKNFPGAEPAGYAEQCLGGMTPAGTQSQTGESPTDTAYAHDIGFVSDNFVSFTLNDFPGQTAIGANTISLFGYDFNAAATVLYAMDNDGQQLGTVDTTTGAFTAIGASVPLTGHTWTGIAVDPNTDAMFACSTDGTVSTLYTVDPGTGAVTEVGPMGTGLMIDISINDAGAMYGHDIGTDSIYTVDTATGAATLVGLTGFDASFAQGMDFDPSDGVLYIFLYQGGGANVFGTVDTATGAVTAMATDNPLGEFEGAVATQVPVELQRFTIE